MGRGWLTHGGTIENGPQAPPDAEGCAVHDGKANVVDGAGAPDEDDEAGGEEVAEPDA